MRPVLFPTLKETLALHERLISQFSGGESGARDLGLLQSALGRPQTGYYESLSLQAGALMHSLAMNDAFLDGDRRIAVALTAVFLRMNGYRLTFGADEGEDFLINRVIKKRADVPEIAAWLSKHAKPVP